MTTGDRRASHASLPTRQWSAQTAGPVCEIRDGTIWARSNERLVPARRPVVTEDDLIGAVSDGRAGSVSWRWRGRVKRDEEAARGDQVLVDVDSTTDVERLTGAFEKLICLTTLMSSQDRNMGANIHAVQYHGTPRLRHVTTAT